MVTSAASPTTAHDHDDIVIGEGVVLQVPPAGLLLRAGSAILDALVIYLGLFISLWALLWLSSNWVAVFGYIGEIEVWMMVGVITLIAFWFFIVPVTVETLSNGRSLGKLVFGLRVVRLDGGAISFRHALVRALVGIAELYGTSGAIAALTGMFSRRSQRVGDLLAGTYAQLERLPTPQPLQISLPPQLQPWAAIADVSRLPDRLSRRIRDFFRQAPRLEPGARKQLAGRLARQAKPYVHPIPDVDAETFLTGVAVLRRDREWRGLQTRQRRMDRLEPVLTQLPHGFPDRG